jgi:branched-subunit amino acid aminotransferase/4-amino-4-deoxychorismate lyase
VKAACRAAERGAWGLGILLVAHNLSYADWRLQVKPALAKFRAMSGAAGEIKVLLDHIDQLKSDNTKIEVELAQSSKVPGKMRRLASLEKLPVFDRDTYLSKLRAKMEPMEKIYAMYNSLVGGVVKDPELMTIPIHDHAIVRGHACFDTCTVAHGRLYRLDLHLDRHLSSITKSRIPLPFGKTVEKNKKAMREIVAQTVVASGCRHASVRYYTSVGPGGFGVVPDGCTSAFYVVVYGAGDDSIFAGGSGLTGMAEYTVTDVPIKPPMLATIKSNNYMLNVLTAMSAQDKGGNFGILLDGEGNIAESCVLNCVFITPDKRLITPPFDAILAGTTVRKVLDLARTKLVAEVSLYGT